MQIVVLRLPLVYGPGIKGNLARLLKIIRLGIPLPLKNIKNKRSIIGIDNLIDVLICCINNKEAEGKTFLLSDGEDLSTPDLLRIMSSSLGKPLYLFSFPVFLLKFASYIFFKENEINKLTDSLRVNIAYTEKTLNWKPQMNIKDGIRNMLQDYDKIF